MTKNRMIVVAGCFEDCPCAQKNNGGGFGEPFWRCIMMDKIIEDKDDNNTNKWMYKNENRVLIHPNCPLKKTDIAKPKNQKYEVKKEYSDSDEYDDEDN